MPLLTTADVAREFRRKPETIQKWVARGWIKPVPKVRPFLFTQGAVEQAKLGQQPIKLY